MKNNDANDQRNQVEETPKFVLEQIIREGARRLLQQAVDYEVYEYIERFKHLKDDKGCRVVVKNGKSPERNILTTIGPLPVIKPRINDKRDGHRFTSSILPRYLRRIPTIDTLLPALYLKGISTGDMAEALESILGQDAPGLSATNIVRLKRIWEAEYAEWSKRDLSQKYYVYFWVDGIHFNVRLEEPDTNRQCMLVIMGADENGKKGLVAILDGYRESKSSWMELLLDIKDRGLIKEPKLAIGDGALGFWAAAEEVYPHMKHQRCWVHKTANILDKMPSSVQPKAKKKIHDIYLAETKEQALVAYNAFFTTYVSKFPKACECLSKDKESLFAFYDFPAEHWVHIRTTNPIESTFATVRHRTRGTKGCGTRLATLDHGIQACKGSRENMEEDNGLFTHPECLERNKIH